MRLPSGRGTAPSSSSPNRAETRPYSRSAAAVRASRSRAVPVAGLEPAHLQVGLGVELRVERARFFGQGGIELPIEVDLRALQHLEQRPRPRTLAGLERVAVEAGGGVLGVLLHEDVDVGDVQ